MVSSTIEHVAITVSDIQDSINFYSRLGFSVIKGPEPHEDGLRNVAFLMMDQVRIEMFAFKKKNSYTNPETNVIGIHHIAYTVQNLEKYYKDLSKNGVEFISKPKKSWSGRKIVFLVDPDGISIQLVENPWLK